MANFHINAKEFLDKLTFDINDIIVEIGSDRSEGSTEWFDGHAKEKNVDFYSIDVVDTLFENLGYLSYRSTRSRTTTACGRSCCGSTRPAAR